MKKATRIAAAGRDAIYMAAFDASRLARNTLPFRARFFARNPNGQHVTHAQQYVQHDCVRRMDETLPLIVIVEDDAALRRAIERLLRLSKRFDPKPFESAEDADVRTCSTAARCVIVDIQLPGQSGPSFYVGLPEPRPPVIFITAFDGPGTQRELSGVGQYALIIKPFLGKDLLAALDLAMRRRT